EGRVVLAGADPDALVGRIDGDRADRQRALGVERRSPCAAAVRRLPHAAVGRAGPQRAVRLDGERAHATRDEAAAAAAIRENGVAVLRVIRVVILGRELRPRAAYQRQRLALLEGREEGGARNARAGRVAHAGLLEDRRADLVEIACGVLGALDLASDQTPRGQPSMWQREG